MSKIEKLKVKAFDLADEVSQIQELYAKKAEELEAVLQEIKKCPK